MAGEQAGADKSPDQQAIDAAADIAEKQRNGASGEVTTSMGIVLKLKPVPPFAIRQAQLRIPEPQVPRVDIGKGRKEENPDDPNYLKRHEEWEMKTNEASMNVLLALGTELVECPDGLQRPEDDSWIEGLEAAGIPMDFENDTARYLSWLRCYALVTAEDLGAVSAAVAQQGGTREADVQQAQASFPGDEARGTDSNVSDEGRGGDGDPVQKTSRRPRSGSRRA